MVEEAQLICTIRRLSQWYSRARVCRQHRYRQFLRASGACAVPRTKDLSKCTPALWPMHLQALVQNLRPTSAICCRSAQLLSVYDCIYVCCVPKALVIRSEACKRVTPPHQTNNSICKLRVPHFRMPALRGICARLFSRIQSGGPTMPFTIYQPRPFKLESKKYTECSIGP
jgi:hypothetical protein